MMYREESVGQSTARRSAKYGVQWMEGRIDHP